MTDENNSRVELPIIPAQSGMDGFILARQGDITNKIASTGGYAFGKGKEEERGDGIIKEKMHVVQTGFMNLLFPLDTKEGDIRITSPAARRMYDILMSDAASYEVFNNLPAVTLPLTRYMEIEGLKNKKETKKKVRENCRELRREVEFRNPDGDFWQTQLVIESALMKGMIHVAFHPALWERVKDYPKMPLNERVFQIKERENPNSYALYRKLQLNADMNAGKLNEHTISVESLLKVTDIKTEEQVKNRKYNEKIRVPFERDMNKLKEIGVIEWRYQGKQPQNFKEFMDSNVEYELPGHPLTSRQKRRARKQENDNEEL